MKVIIESPFKGRNEADREVNREFARKCMLDSLKKGESPFLSHLLYTQVLNEDVEAERRIGLDAAFKWYEVADFVVVYTDRGITKGMKEGIKVARDLKKVVEYRSFKT